MHYPSHTVSQDIACDARTAYAFARREANLPLWASGLASGVVQEKGQWFAQSPMGRIRLQMAPENAFGVLDHDVTLPDGKVFHNAFRVTPAGDGCVFSFVLLRTEGVDDQAFQADIATIQGDLRALKRLLEHP